MAALEGARRIVDMTPDLTGVPPSILATVAPQVANGHVVVAAAQIRLGLLREALVELERARELRALGASEPLPAIDLLEALARYHLGEAEAAARLYDLAREALAVPLSNPDYEETSRALELEVRELLGRD